jgi:hypothetical protein
MVLKAQIEVSKTAQRSESDAGHRLDTKLIGLMYGSVRHAEALIEQRIEIQRHRLDGISKIEIFRRRKSIHESIVGDEAFLRKGEKCISSLELITASLLRSHDIQDVIPSMSVSKILQTGTFFVLTGCRI